MMSARAANELGRALGLRGSLAMKGSSVAAVRRVTNDGKASSANFCSSLLLSSAPACPGTA